MTVGVVSRSTDEQAYADRIAELVNQAPPLTDAQLAVVASLGGES